MRSILVVGFAVFTFALFPGGISHAQPMVVDQVIPPIATDDGSTATAALPVAIAPNDSNLRLDGRFVVTGQSATCSWPASAVTIKFHGTAINANLDLSGNFAEVVVDGVPTKVLSSASKAPQIYSLASGLPDADHTVTVFKRTESFIGNVRLLGFQLNEGATVLPAPQPEHRIEVIGDSISVGYGNEGLNQTEQFKPATENAYMAYGAVAARAFGAGYACYAWSGRQLWPKNTTPSIYPLILPQDPSSPKWDFSTQKPEVVLINLCTNDFGQKKADGTFDLPEEEGWVKAYHDFIAEIRKNYPDATIYLATGPMLNDAWPPELKVLSKARGYIQRVVKEETTKGDAKIKFIEFPPQGFNNGLGSNWHPSLKTDHLMAENLISAIEADLGWKRLAPTP